MCILCHRLSINVSGGSDRGHSCPTRRASSPEYRDFMPDKVKAPNGNAKTSAIQNPVMLGFMESHSILAECGTGQQLRNGPICLGLSVSLKDTKSEQLLKRGPLSVSRATNHLDSVVR